LSTPHNSGQNKIVDLFFSFETAEYTFRTGSYVRGGVENQNHKIMPKLLNGMKSVFVENKFLQDFSRM